MALINLQNVCVRFTSVQLLDKVNFQIEKGERICLLGRNGEGKTTLIKTVNGDLDADEGVVVRQPNLRIGLLAQEVPKDVSGTVFDIITTGLGDRGKLLSEYHQVSNRLAVEDSETLINRLDDIQHSLETDGGWQIHQSVERVISRMTLDADAEFKDMSAGLKRRTLLAKSLVQEPDLLLLDEPTNHLDISAINWLEDFLLKFKGSLLFVTHDRMFLKKIATRIVELDRGKLYDWSCDYETFLQRKQSVLNAEEKQRAEFDKKLAREEVWVRQGIKARRTRNEGRVAALKGMREVRKTRRQRTGTASMDIQGAERSGQKVIVAENISHSYNNIPVIKDFSTTILRGDKLGLIGPNGAGKTTLLNILLGKLKPVEGEITLGSKLQIAYFDQLRDQLDENESVKYNISYGYDTLTINDKPRNVIGYLQDFLFTPERAHSPVIQLSGGERNRLLLARLFSKPSNVLVMDEPTNDLDAETLELLEELLLDYKGTLLLVSHDRAFLNNVVTSIVAFEDNGVVKEYTGGYDDWLRQQDSDVNTELSKASKSKKNKKQKKQDQPAKLSYKEKKELEDLPQQIENLEQEQRKLHQTMADPDFFRKERDETEKINEQLKSIENELGKAYKRWEELEELEKS
ncbi:MAG: ATP-binding cassette domain-containing protein, partial [Candidatus Anammoxibacter sp.]